MEEKSRYLDSPPISDRQILAAILEELRRIRELLEKIEKRESNDV